KGSQQGESEAQEGHNPDDLHVSFSSCKSLCNTKHAGAKKRMKGAASPFPGGVDDRFHALEIALQGAAAGVGQPVLRLRHPSLEVLLAGDVAGLFQLAGVNAEVAVRRLEQLLEIVEAQVIVHRQGA